MATLRSTFLRAALFVMVALSLSSQLFAQYSRHTSPTGGYGGYGYAGGGYGGYSGGYGRTASANPYLGRPNNLSLVVAQTQEGHEGVSDLLNQLRRLQDQQVRNELRFNTLNDSFYERQGVNFGFNLRGADPAGGRGVIGLDPTGQPTPNGDLQFRQGGAASAVPQFGGHDAGSDGTLGFATRGNEGDLLFNFFSGQGSSRSNVTQAPVVVIPNGGSGTVSDTSQTPFVTGVIPVVGAPNMQAMTGYGLPLSQPQSVVQQRLQQLQYERIRPATQPSTAGNGQGLRPAPTKVSLPSAGGPAGGPSSADHGDLSVAAIRRQQQSTTGNAADSNSDMSAWIERARGAEDAGKVNVALIYYKMAARRASGDQKQQLIDKIRELDGQ